MLSAVIAYLHYLSFMVLFAALSVELLLLQPTLNVATAKRIVVTDLCYGIAALSLLFTGLLRFAYFEKGMQFYLVNPVFYLKVGLFLTVGLLSIFPTIEFLSWRTKFKHDEDIRVAPQKYAYLKQVLKIELGAAAMIPLLAALMARGLGTDLV